MKKLPKPLICIDIGNTSISAGRFKGGKLIEFKEFMNDDIPKLSNFIRLSGGITSKNILISSVVPKLSSLIIKHLRHIKTLKILVLGRDIGFKIRSKYRKYSQLGMDRKINIYGARRIYRGPMVIFDFGTATSVEYISKQGVFEGGLILPGVKSSLDFLHEKTALLPAVRIHPTTAFLGRDTRSGMIAGVLHGFGAMVDGLKSRFRRRYGPNIKTIATGGLADIVKRYCTGFDHVDPYLTLKSMVWIYEDWIAKKSAGRS